MIAVGAPAVKPTLALLSAQPLRVHGSHFTPRSAVRIFGAGSGVTKVRVTARGTFTIVVPVSADTRCTGVVVQAVGVHGERASVAVGMPNCGAGDAPY